MFPSLESEWVYRNDADIFFYTFQAKNQRVHSIHAPYADEYIQQSEQLNCASCIHAGSLFTEKQRAMEKHCTAGQGDDLQKEIRFFMGEIIWELFENRRLTGVIYINLELLN